MNIFEHKWLCGLLAPLSWIYGGVTEVRNWFYDRGWLHSEKISDCKIISIGNITVGGTGKTPAVAAIAQALQQSGKRVAILSRGYGRNTNGTVVVSDGASILSTPSESGDEPFLLAQKLPGVIVIAERDRVKGAHLLREKFKPDVIILDDAFQHRRIQRDIDIVLIDSSVPLECYSMLPSGMLRENWHNLKRADMIWLTRINQSAHVNHLMKHIQKITSVPVIQTRHQPAGLFSPSRKKIALKQINGKRIYLFSGIGNPASFRKTVVSLGALVISEKIFQDHHAYSGTDIEKIVEQAGKEHIDFIITTEKDMAKLSAIIDPTWPIHFLSIELETEVPLAKLTKV